MQKVIADITMSLDGYVTGPGADQQHGLGDAPELHTWVTDQDEVDAGAIEVQAIVTTPPPPETPAPAPTPPITCGPT